MNDALEVSGAITMGGMSVLTTDTAYTKTAVDNLLLEQEPKFNTPGPILKSLNFETGAIDLILDSDFIANIDAKANTTDLAAYQPMLIDSSDEGRNLLRSDGVTLLAIEEGQFMKITPEFSIRGSTPVNFRLKIGITNEFANQVIDATSNIATLQTQIANIQSPFWIAGKIAANGNVLSSLGRYALTSTKSTTGVYTITPPTNNPFPNENYVINITCAVDTASAYARVARQQVTTTSFLLMTYVNGATADCSFMISVIA
jgi:hypothetical protein